MIRPTLLLRQEKLKLRPAFELALRASCLQLVLARWGLETAALMGLKGEQTASDGDDRKTRAVETITAAMYESGLDDHATAMEKAMLDKPYRGWEYKDYTYGDHWEALGVLQWLLGRHHAIPPYYSHFDRARLFQNSGIMPAQPSTIEKFVDPFMSSQTKQSLDTEQLQHQVDVAEAWVWRARAQVLLDLRQDLTKQHSSSLEKSKEETPAEATLKAKHVPHSLRKLADGIPKIIPRAAQSAHAKKLIQSIESDDYAIAVEMKNDKDPLSSTTQVPYTHLEAEHLDAIRKISESRFLALAWSVGRVSVWDTDKLGDIESINTINALWTPDNDDR